MLLISDANIFIDLEKLGLLPLMSRLSHEIKTTDMVYQELYPYQQALLDQIQIEQFVFEADELLEFYSDYQALEEVGISVPDYSLVFKAKKHSYAGIVSGDKKLRNFSKRQNIQVFGIFFIFDRLLDESLIEKAQWIIKLKELEQLNPRLPVSEFKKRYKRQ